LALLQSLKNNGLSQTRILLFRPGSGIPFRTCSMPLGVRNVAWYSLAQGQNSDFSLVGVTDSWGVALFGDDVKSPTSPEGTTTTQMTGNLPRKNTLLQDIFGKSAFDDVVHPTVSTETSTSIPRQGKQAITAFFDAPAYLMPPLETMFDSIMQTFLTPRSTTEDGERVEKGDEEMEVDEYQMPEEDAPLIVKNTTRVVDEREMYEFVEIFKQYGFTGLWEHRVSD
jgi:NET1-associated nuclear protein 1 (U3 small nucleolar RNA-associated protein 17)